MFNGFIRTAAASPKLKPADVAFNVSEILKLAEEAHKNKVKVLVFPELAVTGYTCGDLFFQKKLSAAAREGIRTLAEETRDFDMLIFVGFPFVKDGRLFNTAAALKDGRVRALIPKRNLPEYIEYYEKRYFAPGPERCEEALVPEFGDEPVPFGTDIIIRDKEAPELMICAEICEDMWVPFPPSARHAAAGASLIVNLSASDETAGKAGFRRDVVLTYSSRISACYVYASAGPGESSTDLVFGAHRMIAEDGALIAESELYEEGLTIADADIERVTGERIKRSTFHSLPENVERSLKEGYRYVDISFADERDEHMPASCRYLQQFEDGTLKLIRPLLRHPFVPETAGDRDVRCREIINIQAHGLKKRMEHIGTKHAVIGISGGLDSTLALLVTCKTCDMLGISRENIIGVTMPAFGTTDRTYKNALELVRSVGAELREIDIRAAVNQHFKDIGHDPAVKNAAYENSQARERTQILMDIANDCGGIVIGTGDLSELALGWCTYNGDHMSMYAVNADVPKTLVRFLVRYFADFEADDKLKRLLCDILDTPVSPELLPPDEKGVIAQKTEDLVGPYELHDFFLFNILRYGFSPSKVFIMCMQAFEGDYSAETVLGWMDVFYRRFFSQQFKRSCSVDGPKVGSVDLSPRGGWRMPSDAVCALWRSELEELKKNLSE